MARLPRYQESGLVAGDIPRLDFANLREESNVMQGIGNALDRVSQFAFGEAKKEQDKANKLTAIQVRSELEGVVQRKIADLTFRVERGELTNYSQIQSEIQALSGLSDGLVDLDIDQANGLMASIRSSGSTLLAKSSKIMTDAHYAVVQSEINQDMSAVAKNLETSFEVHQDPATLAKIVSENRAKIYARAIQAPALLPKAIEGFDSVAKAAERSAMVKYFTSEEFGVSESERLAKLDANDGGKFSQLWSAKPEADRLEIKKAMYQSVVDKAAAKKRDADLTKTNNDLEYVDAYKQYMSTKDPVKRAELAKVLVRTADTTEEIDRVLKAPEDGGDALLFSNLREDVQAGRITDHRQLQRFLRPGGIDKTQLNSLQTQLYQQRDEGEKTARRRIREQAGIGPNVGFFDPKEARVVKGRAIEDRFDRFLADAVKANEALPPEKVKPIDYNEILQKALDDYKATDEKNQVVNAAKAKLAQYGKLAQSKGRQVEINQDTNVDDLAKLKVFRPEELDAIRNQIKIIRDNQTQ